MSQTTSDPKEVFSQNLRSRFYKVLDYFSLFSYIVLVSIGALVADTIIVFVIKQTIINTVNEYPIVKLAFDWFQIGSAFLALFGAMVHAVFSAWSQLQFELQSMREER